MCFGENLEHFLFPLWLNMLQRDWHYTRCREFQNKKTMLRSGVTADAAFIIQTFNGIILTSGWHQTNNTVSDMWVLWRSSCSSFNNVLCAERRRENMVQKVSRYKLTVTLSFSVFGRHDFSSSACQLSKLSFFIWKHWNLPSHGIRLCAMFFLCWQFTACQTDVPVSPVLSLLFSLTFSMVSLKIE